MKNIQRILAHGAIPAGLLIGGLYPFVAPVRAVGLTTYAGAKNGYAFRYPSGWINKPAAGEDFDIFSPDNNTLLEGGAVQTPPGDTLAKLRTTFVNELKTRKAKADTIKVGTTDVHGQIFATVMGEVPINGTQFQTIIWVARRAKKSYVFDGVWGLGQPATRSEQAEVKAWLNSITF
jgi:hypothetical protein